MSDVEGGAVSEISGGFLEGLSLANYDSLPGDEMVELMLRKEHLNMILAGLPNAEVFPIPYDPEHSMPSFALRPKNFKGGA